MSEIHAVISRRELSRCEGCDARGHLGWHWDERRHFRKVYVTAEPEGRR
jgi:hypothetical protein